jgi:hypothetical protein
VNWGWWPEGGTAEALDAYYPRIGLNAMSSEDAFNGLAALLSVGCTQAAVMSIEWNVFKPICEAQGPFPVLEGIHAEEQASGRTDESENGDFRRLWARTAVDDRPGVLSTHIREQLSHVLGFENPGDIDAGEGFFNMGMDSITTFQFMKRLVQSIEHAFPVTLAFEHPNVEALCRYLMENVLNDESPVPSAGDFSARAPSAGLKGPAAPLLVSGVLDASQAQALLTHLDQLTDDEVEQVLADMSSKEEDDS